MRNAETSFRESRRRRRGAEIVVGLLGALVVAVGLLASTGPGAAASTLTVVAGADAFVSKAAPNANNGTAQYLRTSTASSTFNSYLRFDLTGLAGTVAGATLQLFSRSTQTGTYRVYATGPFTETTITWANAPAFGAQVGSFTKNTRGSWTSVPITSGVTAGAVVTVAQIGRAHV